MTAIDLYLLRRSAGSYAAVLGIVLLLMTLENMSRLLPRLHDVRDPIALLARFMLSLLPEYAAIGIFVALFLSVALAARQLSLSGEWQIFSAIGVSPRRILLVPLLVATASAGGQLAIRLVLQPAGEQRIDMLGMDLARGMYGVSVSARSFSNWDERTMFSVERIDAANGRLHGVFLSRGADILTAASARAGQDDNGGLSLLLENGQLVRQGSDGHFDRVDFGRYSLTLASKDHPGILRSTSDSLDRIAVGPLLRRIAREHDGAPRPALAALASRCGYAVFCLLLPWFAIPLGTPGPRSRTGLGLMAGIALIVGFVRSSTMIESGFAEFPVSAACVHLALWACLAGLLWRFEQRRGPGACEAVLDRLLARPLRRLTGIFAAPRRSGRPA